MSGEIINFRKAKKAHDRKAKEREADANRLKFGRTKAERKQTAAEEDLKARRIDAHLRDAGPTPKKDDPA